MYWPIIIKFRIRKQTLLPNSENREHLKNFRSAVCVLANYNKVQDTQADLTAKLTENPEHLKNFRSVVRVLANYNKVQDTQANLKTTN